MIKHRDFNSYNLSISIVFIRKLNSNKLYKSLRQTYLQEIITSEIKHYRKDIVQFVGRLIPDTWEVLLKRNKVLVGHSVLTKLDISVSLHLAVSSI